MVHLMKPIQNSDIGDDMKKLTEEQKLAIAIKALKIYSNIDFWQYRNADNKGDPRYTSLEVVDSKDGKIKDGWEWAEEALSLIE